MPPHPLDQLIAEAKKEAEDRLALDTTALLDKLGQLKAEVKFEKGRGWEKRESESLDKEEQLYLFLWLCGYSLYNIAFRICEKRVPRDDEICWLNLDIKRKLEQTIKPKISKTLNFCIKKWMGIDEPNTPVPNHREFVDFLERNGYIFQRTTVKITIGSQEFYLIIKENQPIEVIINTLKNNGFQVEIIENGENSFNT